MNGYMICVNIVPITAYSRPIQCVWGCQMPLGTLGEIWAGILKQSEKEFLNNQKLYS